MFEDCLSARSKDTLCQPCVVILSKHYHVTWMISWTNKRIEVLSVCDPCIMLHPAASFSGFSALFVVIP